MWKKLLTAAAVAICAGDASAATISTLDYVNAEATPWGYPETAIYGQAVTFTQRAAIQSFEFRVNDKGTPITYTFYVYAWDGDSVTGPALFTSSGRTPGSASLSTQALYLNHLQLPAGQYVLFLEATSSGSAVFAAADNLYSGGSWVYFDKEAGFGLTDPWYVGTHLDLSFRVIYSPVN